MNAYPKISLVTQVFNRERYIAQTIESVLSQQYPNLEYIVIDDGSTDKSWEIIQRYAHDLARCEQFPGMRTTPVPAINRGFSFAGGEILGWLNTKNTLLPKSLFSVADAFGSFPEIEWLTGLASVLDDYGRVVKVSSLRKNKYDFLIRDWRTIQQESTFFRRSLWERTGGALSEKYPWSFDTGLWIKFFQEAELYHLTTLVGTYRKVPSGQSVRDRAVFEEHTEKALKELYDSVSSRDRTLAMAYRILRLGKPLLRNIPNKLYLQIPLLNSFYHRTVEFDSFADGVWSLHTYRRNPFRATLS
ncbi:MAG: glycosyltransferase [Candidatus Sungbacteria bacterium]|nr:glycosyltransferase [Candidatus Sungbacteria bacterium]